jgi:AraC-like DNA-binding protein
MNISPRMAELMEESLESKFRGQWDMSPESSHFKGWTSFPNPMISLMLEGKAELSIRSPRAETVVWDEGDAVCLLPSMSRAVRILSGGKIHYCGVALSLSVLHGLDPLSFFDLPLLYPNAAAGPLGRVIKDLMAAGRWENPLREAVGRRALCGELLNLLLEPAGMTADAERRLARVEKLAAAVKYLSANYTEKPDLARLARLSCLSKSRFHAVFSGTVGCAPSEFVRRLRLEKAAVMLASGSLSVSEIGQSLGWGDQFHFSRTFKNFFGVSPRTFREECANGAFHPAPPKTQVPLLSGAAGAAVLEEGCCR